MARPIPLTVALMLAMVMLTGGRAGAAPGTFVIAEGQGGYAFGGAFAEDPSGPGARATLGAGGRVAGSAWRLYGIGSFTFAQLGGAVAAPGQRTVTSRRWRAWTLGLRTMVPIWGRLRWLSELSLGHGEVASNAIVNGGSEVYSDQDGAVIADIGMGLQYRVGLRLSLGVRADLTVPMNLERFDLVGALAGAGARGVGFNSLVFGTITVHL